ncbi:MAG: chorismate-binding protein, partial [Planctomycetales bacterium]|nr:chorismate-binding protein [Planctomycetales bacterium]
MCARFSPEGGTTNELHEDIELTRCKSVTIDSIPHIESLPSELTSIDVFRRLSNKPHCLFLDSALPHSQLGRFSYVTADPFEFLSFSSQGEANALHSVKRRLECYSSKTIPGLPPFQGGAAGMLSYGLSKTLEAIPDCRYDDFNVPILAIGLYDVVVVFDHQTGESWIISQGFSAESKTRSVDHARRRADQFREWLLEPVSDSVENDHAIDLPVKLSGKQFDVDRLSGLKSNFSPDGYLHAVRQVVDYIHAGDAFQVNLAQRLVYPAMSDSRVLYERLRERNPATFAGYFDIGEFQIVSASPERFLRVVDNHVETRPIKGTRRRVLRPEADMFAGREMQE